MNRGRLIAFEGVDGCGKTTQLGRLEASLRRAGCDVVATREPTDGPTGNRIRQMARSGAALEPSEELRWFVEDRRVHVAEVITPALRVNRVVLTDRYYLSTVAYQGARGLDFEKILADSEAEFPIPDLVVLLEMDPAQALGRVQTRGGVVEGVFEHQDFLDRVDAVFRSIDRPYLERVTADRDLEEIEQEIATRVRKRFPQFPS